MAFVDGSVVLPILIQEFQADPTHIGWTINAYLLPVGELMLLGEGLGDDLGRRHLFLVGLAGFRIASMVCAVAPTLPWLFAGRALQGIGRVPSIEAGADWTRAWHAADGAPLAIPKGY